MEKEKVFVIMPFKDEFFEVYEMHSNAEVEAFKYGFRLALCLTVEAITE